MIQYDSDGIITQTLTEILDERESNLKQYLGEDFIIDKDSPIGSMELADANNELSVQELIAWLIPNMLDANTAEGYFLDCICEKNRIYRKQPQYTTLYLTINGISGTKFLSGDITISDNLSGIYYNLDEDCTIGDDGTVLCRFKCQDYGEYYPLSTSTFEIQTPVYGLDGVTLNYSTASLNVGRDTESDEELRRRRKESVGQTSTNTLASIKGNIFSLDGVQHVTYYENDTETTNSLNIPMKSFEFIVDGGDEDDIATTILNNKPAGTRAYGTTNINVLDSEGVVHSIGFTKVTDINLKMNIEISITSSVSEEFKNQIRTAIKDKFDEIQDIGANVKDYTYFAILTQFNEISDISSITFSKLNLQESETKYTINEKEIARLIKENIYINISN